jgi:hypothetical protein
MPTVLLEVFALDRPVVVLVMATLAATTTATSVLVTLATVLLIGFLLSILSTLGERLYLIDMLD